MPVVEPHRCLDWSRQRSFCGVRSWHCLGQVDDMPAGVSFFSGRVHRYTAGLNPAIRAGKGWRGRRELAPRCSATQLGASHARARTDSPCR